MGAERKKKVKSFWKRTAQNARCKYIYYIITPGNLGSPFQKGLQVGQSWDSLLEEQVFYWNMDRGYSKKRTKGLHSPFIKGHQVQPK